MRLRGLILNIPPAERALLHAGETSGNKHRKAASKLDKAHEAAQEVARHRALIDALTTLHRDVSPEWDWDEMRLEGAPAKPVLKRDRQTAALRALRHYSPSILDKLTGKAKEKRSALIKLFDEAERQDAQTNKTLKEEYARTHAEWKERVDLAAKVVARNPAAYYDALKLLNPFGRIPGLGRSVGFSVEDGRTLQVEIAVYSEDEFPKEVKVLSKNGNVATREMPPTMLRGLHATHVCSAVLRAAREAFALLPVDVVIITATALVLNTRTGHSTNMPILSAAITRRGVQALNFLALDPVEAMTNFLHRMDFKKIKGFSPIVPLEPSDVA
jgi:hypothetical protein